MKSRACIVLSLLLSLLSFSKASAYEPDDGDAAEPLGRIVVTPRRSLSQLGDLSENMELVGGSELGEYPGQQLSGILQYVPGVDIEPRSGPGQATALSIQGSDSRQVRVMIDGILLNTPSSGQANPSIFPRQNIKQIEVVKGSGSSAWGSSLGGVVNMITRDTGETAAPSGSVTSSVGGFGTAGESFDLSGKTLGVGYYVMGSYRDSGGSLRGDTLEKQWFNKLSYRLPDGGSVYGSFGYSGGAVNSGKLPDDTWLAQPYRARYGKIGLEEQLAGTALLMELKHFRQDSSTRMFPSVDDETPFFETNIIDRVYQLSATGSRAMRDGDSLVFGADLEYNLVKADPYLPAAKSLNSFAPYANYTFVTGPWDLIAGLRYDHNSEFGGELSPSAGGVFHFNDPRSTLLKAKVSRAFSAPPLLWRYNDNPALGAAPNPDIRAERGIVYELAVESSPVRRLRMKGSVYRAEISDALAAEEVSPGLFMMNNFAKFRRQGAALEARIMLCRGLSALAAAGFNDIENRATRKTVRGGGRARQSFDLGLDYDNSRGFICSLKGYFKRWNQPASVEPNDRKFIADAGASQQIGRNIKVFCAVYNIFNSAYWADKFFPIRTRYVEGGLTVAW